MTKFLNLCVLIVCSLLPLYIVRFKIFGVPTTLLEILILTLFLVWFFIKGLSETAWKKFFDVGNFFYPVIFFLLTSIFATIVSVDKNGALGILKAFFLEPVILFLVIFERAKAGAGKFILAGLLIAASWISALAVFQKLTGLGAPGDALFELAQGRVVGVYNSANSLALFLGPVFAVSFGWFLTRAQSVKNGYFVMFTVFLLFLQLVAIILTKSQAGLLAILGVFLWFFLAKYLSSQKFVLAFSIICAFVIFLNLAIPLLAFLGLNLGQVFADKTLQNRYYLWKGSVNLIINRPITGAGLDGFKEEYGKSYRFPEYDELVQYPHNLVLNFWSELGVFGLVAFFWLIIVFIRQAVVSQGLKLGLLAAILYILIHGIFDVPYFKNDLSTQFFILLALTGFSKTSIPLRTKINN